MDSNLVDRLMPRHPVGLELPIDWDVHLRRKLWQTSEHAVPALIREISLLGALVDAPIPPAHSVGDRVQIRMQGRTGLVEIRHARPAYTHGRALFGVMFVDVRDLEELIADIVGYLRSQEDDTVDDAWEHAR